MGQLVNRAVLVSLKVTSEDDTDSFRDMTSLRTKCLLKIVEKSSFCIAS